MLLQRAKVPALQAIEHLIGLQAQAPFPPYFGLWSRLEGFVPDELAQLILDRRVVRIALMRNTVHLVTAEDCMLLLPLLRPMLERPLGTNAPYSRDLAGMDLAELAAAARNLVEERPLTTAEM